MAGGEDADQTNEPLMSSSDLAVPSNPVAVDYDDELDVRRTNRAAAC